ncbi:MAG: hypothetical protein CVU89_13610 [Firmicutes bacterium HGW-Firmicutes-14]|nr:MAG: hypothetical protein CVU89_13610 [Firmicutes bacterium HGW-Firmicutes-14]
MRKQLGRQKSVLYIVFLTAVLLFLLPGAVFASDIPQTLDLKGYNDWKPLVQTVSVASDTINVGETTQVTFEITAPHEVDVLGTFSADFSGVVDSVSISSLYIHLEIENGLNNWVPYQDRAGNDVIIPVVTSPQPVTNAIMQFPVDYPINISSYDTVGKNLRWASYMTIERNGIPDDNVYSAYQIISRWYAP